MSTVIGKIVEVVRWIIVHKPKISRIIVHTHNTKASHLMEETLLEAGYNVTCVKFNSIDYDEFRDE